MTEQPPPNILVRLGHLLLWPLLLYGAGASLLLLLRLLSGESLWPVLLFNNFLPALLLPALLFLPLLLLLRRWRAAALQAPPALAFALMYGTLFLPTVSAPTPAADAPQISVLTFNLSLRNRDFEAVVQMLRAVDADVVALQEVNRAAYFYLDDDLADLYPYRAFHPDLQPPGQAVLSRFPILEDNYWQVERAHQRVLLDFGGTPIVLYNVHPVHFTLNRRVFFSFEAQQREIDDILARTVNENVPLLLVGDFNTSDQSAMYQRFAALYSDAFRTVGSGLGLTFPGALPLARLDYVFYNPAFVPLEALVWPDTGGSDHHPVFARLAWVGQSG
ncbi:MAG: endonuclease/exonuclease/phosphatase family protein [Chloroflexi bacterium]|nr:endonuclease/exonuclease/phosphatase family protein [Chloroflexota bacterium]